MSASSQTAFVDTNVLIYAHNLDAGTKHELAKTLIEGLWSSGQGKLSVQVLNEFYVNITQKIQSPVKPETARAIVEPYLSWQPIVPAADSTLRASEIQQRHRLSFWDAMIVHAAVLSGAETLYSEDLNAGQLIEGIRVVNPVSTSGVHET